MTAAEILKRLEALGRDSYRKVLRKHGVREPVFGVTVAELKKIQRAAGKDYQLALDLYETGVYDAQYLAGLIADETKMTKKDLRQWVAKANCLALCGTTVGWVAAESRHGRALALEWIDAKGEATAQAGWATLTSLVAIKDDADLDTAELRQLLRRVERTIHDAPNLVRYAMNGFVIAVGTRVQSLTELAREAGERIGRVSVDMGDTACQVPYAPAYIEKAGKRGSIGKKRKTARC